jgi:hypothetical protein
MPIWGNRDKEQPAEEPSTGAERESGPPDEAAVDSRERAQGRRPALAYGRDPSGEQAPADAPGQNYQQVPAGTPDPARSPSPAAETMAPGAPVPTAGPVPEETMAPGEIAPTGAVATGTPGSGAGPASAEAEEPAGALARAENVEPARAPAAEAMEPAGAPAPAMTESPAGTDAPAPVLTEEVVVIDEETAVKDPAAATAGTASPAAAVPTGAAAASHDGISAQRWSKIMATFVDDPRGSVKMAADAVDSAIEQVVTSIRAHRQALASSWQDGGTDTEQLRTALREYRKFGAQVQQMSPAAPDGQGTTPG